MALYNKLFAKTPSPPAEIARAKPKSPTRQTPQAAAAVVPPSYGEVDASHLGRKRKRGGSQWNNYANNYSGGEGGACFRCGEFGHKKEECPLKNKDKSV